MKFKYLSYIFIFTAIFAFKNIASADIGICTGTCEGPYMELQSISPQQPYPGDQVSLTGIFKGAENLKVYLFIPYGKTSLPITPKKVTDDRVTFIIPNDLTLGDYSIYVDHDGSCKVSCGSNSLSLRVTEPIPLINYIKMKGESKNEVLLSGKKAYIYGKGFTEGITGSLSTGEKIEIKYISATQAYFVVPQIAAGPVTAFVSLENEYGNKSNYTYQVSMVGENNVYKTKVESSSEKIDNNREALLKQIEQLKQIIAALIKRQAAMKATS